MICKYCNRDTFKSEKSFIAHQTSCKQNPNRKVTVLSNESEALISNRLRNRAIEKYNLDPKLCQICNGAIGYAKRNSRSTCSIECSSILRSSSNSRIHSIETKEKISAGINKFNESKGFIKYKEYVCGVCGITFRSIKQKSICTNELCIKEYKLRTNKKISNSVKLAFKEGRHLGNEYRNRKTNSYLENSFIIYLEKNFPEIVYSFNYVVKMIDNNGKYIKSYYIDFYFPLQNIGIELDGSQHLKTIEYDINRDNEIFNHYNIKIIRITYKEYFNKTRYDEINQLLKNEIALMQNK